MSIVAVPVSHRLTTSQYSKALVRHTPDMYLSELRQRLEMDRGVSTHESSISRSPHRAGYSMKDSVSALEQNKDARCQYILTVGLNFSAEQLMFVDESACNRITTCRRCAWAPVGNRARRLDRFVRGKRQVPLLVPTLCVMPHSFIPGYSILPAMLLDKRLSGNPDLRWTADSKIFVYMSQCKQKNPILFFFFFFFQKAVYRFAIRWKPTVSRGWPRIAVYLLMVLALGTEASSGSYLDRELVSNPVLHSVCGRWSR